MTELKRNPSMGWIAVPAMVAAALWAGPARAADEAGKRVGCLAFPLVRQIAEGRVVVPTAVVLRNPHPEFSGVIEAWIGDRKEAHVCRRPVTVGKGEFRFYLYPQAGEQGSQDSLYVKLVEPGGQSSGSIESILRRVQGQSFVLAVVGRDRFFGTQELSALKTVVNQVRQTELLPDQWYGYGMFDAVFWDGQVTTPLEPVQKKALADWIRSGGTLILGAKAGDLTAHSPVPDLVPDLHLIESAAKNGRVVIRAAEMPAVSDRPFAMREVGLGRIVFPQTDFGDVASWPWGHQWELVGGQPTSKQTQGVGGADDRTLQLTLHPWREFQPLLARWAGYTALNFTPILITMLVYILVVSVVDYVVLKKAKRLPWTWVTFPAMIVLFSAYSFFSFYKGRLGNLIRHEILSQDVARDGSCRFKAWSCIRNNSNRPIRFDLEASHFLAEAETIGDDSYYPSYNRRSLSSELNARGWTQEAAPRGGDSVSIPAYVGSYCFIEEEWTGHETRRLCEANFRYTNAGLDGQIVDRSRTMTAANTFVLFADRIYEVDGQLRVANRPAPRLSPEQASPISADGAPAVSSVLAWARREAQMARLSAFWETKPPPNGHVAVSRRADLVAVRRTTEREAVIITCYEEQTQRGGLPVSRVTCVRRVVDVVSEENNHD